MHGVLSLKSFARFKPKPNETKMTLFYAQPFNISVEGFYFQTVDQYKEQAAGLTDSFGMPVEEFDIQFIEGGQIDPAMF